jgi:membrane-bound metal-dependent hydrolase YbcI (DUF457 family)
MLFKTHLTLGIFASLFFLPHVVYKLTFIPVVILASLLPDIGQLVPGLRSISLSRLARPAIGPRGFLHSFTFCFAVTLLFTWYSPILALPFFLGFGVHLIADSITVEGICPFWPFGTVSEGRFKIGGPTEHAFFLSMCLIDAALLVGFFI